MRHHSNVRKFGRVRKVRRALMRELAVSLTHREKIVTTEAKAKELRPMIEKLVTAGKTKNLASQRLLVSKVGTLSAKKLINVLGPKYKDRNGGFTRILKMTNRKGDNAQKVIFELDKLGNVDHIQIGPNTFIPYERFAKERKRVNFL